MNRSEIEVVLNRDRAWLLDTYAAMPVDELVRGITASEYDPSSMWSAQDHLAHLAGIEKNFNGMIRRHFVGDPNPVRLVIDADGQPRTRDQIMAAVHEMTEAWVREHRGRSLSEVVAVGQAVRAETLALLSELTDAQLEEKAARRAVGRRHRRRGAGDERRPRPYALGVDQRRPGEAKRLAPQKAGGCD